MSASQIKAGPELDDTVARLLGLEHQARPGTFHTSPFAFRPSSDLNHAFIAAEACKLFEFRALGWDDGWEFIEHQGNGEYSTLVDRLETPCLAICAAILNLKGG